MGEMIFHHRHLETGISINERRTRPCMRKRRVRSKGKNALTQPFAICQTNVGVGFGLGFEVR